MVSGCPYCSMSRTKPGIFGAYKNSELGTASNVFVALRPHVLQLCARQQQSSALKGCWASPINPSEAAFKQLLLHPHVRLKQQKPSWVTPTGFSTYPRMLPALEPWLEALMGMLLASFSCWLKAKITRGDPYNKPISRSKTAGIGT